MPSLESRKTISAHDFFPLLSHPCPSAVGVCQWFVWDAMGGEHVIRSYRALNDNTNVITLSVRQELHRGPWGLLPSFLSLIPMHVFVSKEEVFQCLGERKQQTDTMQSEKPNRCVAAKD